MLSLHRALRTWTKAVDAYIALTDFARAKFVQGGLPKQKIVVKPNFMSFDPGQGTGEGGYALFVGRLTEDKGVQTLIGAWRQLAPHTRLRVAGDGPLLGALSDAAAAMPNVEVLGARSREEVISLMKAANVLIVPSRWYEGFPMTIVEAYACGLPVIASDLGSLSSVVSHGETGLLFPPGASTALAASVTRLFADEEERRSMRKKARSTFERLYSPEPAYSGLMSVYATAKRQQSVRGTREVALSQDLNHG